jgi:hypothetical protein
MLAKDQLVWLMRAKVAVDVIRQMPDSFGDLWVE